MTTPIERPPGGLQPERLKAGPGGLRAGGRRRSVARLAAVQALYQLELNREVDPEVVVREFGRHRLGREIDGDRYGEADPALVSAIGRGVAADHDRLAGQTSRPVTQTLPFPPVAAV